MQVLWLALQSLQLGVEQRLTLPVDRFAPLKSGIVGLLVGCWQVVVFVSRYQELAMLHPVQVLWLALQSLQLGVEQRLTFPVDRFAPLKSGIVGLLVGCWQVVVFVSRYQELAVLHPVQVVWLALQSLQLGVEQRLTFPVDRFAPLKSGIVGLLVGCWQVVVFVSRYQELAVLHPVQPVKSTLQSLQFDFWHETTVLALKFMPKKSGIMGEMVACWH